MLTQKQYELAIQQTIKELSECSKRMSIPSAQDRLQGQALAYNEAIWKLKNNIRLAEMGYLGQGAKP